MTPLQVDIIPNPHALLVALKGDAGLPGSEELERAITPLLAQHPRLLIFDLSQMVFICSLAMGVLVAARKGIALHGGSIRLAAPQPQVREALERAMLTPILPISDTLAAALSLPEPSTQCQ